MTAAVTYDWSGTKWSVGEGHKVSKFERLLMPESTELPECLCGSEMKIIKSDAIGSDGEVRTYRCPQCEHELRLTMWETP
jgi:hypothetical protein